MLGHSFRLAAVSKMSSFGAWMTMELVVCTFLRGSKNVAQKAFVSHHFHAPEAARDRPREKGTRRSRERRRPGAAENARAEREVEFVDEALLEQAAKEGGAPFAYETLDSVAGAEVFEHRAQVDGAAFGQVQRGEGGEAFLRGFRHPGGRIDQDWRERAPEDAQVRRDAPRVADDDPDGILRLLSPETRGAQAGIRQPHPHIFRRERSPAYEQRVAAGADFEQPPFVLARGEIGAGQVPRRYPPVPGHGEVRHDEGNLIFLRLRLYGRSGNPPGRLRGLSLPRRG